MQSENVAPIRAKARWLNAFVTNQVRGRVEKSGKGNPRRLRRVSTGGSVFQEPILAGAGQLSELAESDRAGAACEPVQRSNGGIECAARQCRFDFSAAFGQEPDKELPNSRKPRR